MDSEILTIDEVAKYLRVSERTIYEWIQKGTIPCGKIGNNWRFKKSDLQRWVDERLTNTQNNTTDTKTNSSPSGKDLLITNVLKAQSCVLLEPDNKEAVLTQLCHTLCESEHINNHKQLQDAIFAREELMSTGIGLGIAVPHVRLNSFSRMVMAAGVSKTGIKDYESLDGQEVKIVIMIAAGTNQHSAYLKMLSYISKKLKNPQTRQSLLQAVDSAQVHSILTSN